MKIQGDNQSLDEYLMLTPKIGMLRIINYY